MRRLIGAMFIAVLAASGLASAQTTNDWWWVCHEQGNGDRELIVVGQGAVKGHSQHGDVIIVNALLPPPDCSL